MSTTTSKRRRDGAADEPVAYGRDTDRVRSYYGLPIVKEPAWTWEVPWYLLAGGLAGGSALGAVLADAAGHTEMARRTRLVAAGAAALSPPLLISDLGRPSRFLNMLRAFKPTSAMSMGSWLLAAFAPAAITAAGLDRAGRLPALRTTASGVAAGLGPPLATYTAVLMSDSSNPAWHGARHTLPFVFAASAAASTGAAMSLVGPASQTVPARRLAVAGGLVELAAAQAMRHRLGSVGRVYEEEGAGRFDTAAKVCTAAGAALVALGGRRRLPRVVGAGLLLAGAACTRWSVFEAGFQAARDPEHVVRPQRDG